MRRNRTQPRTQQPGRVVSIKEDQIDKTSFFSFQLGKADVTLLDEDNVTGQPE